MEQIVSGRASQLILTELILNDDEKNGKTESYIKIYSFKVLFISFHLKSQAVSWRRILSSCCFDLAI